MWNSGASGQEQVSAALVLGHAGLVLHELDADLWCEERTRVSGGARGCFRWTRVAF